MLYDRAFAINNPELHLQEKQLFELFSSDEKLVIFDIGACEGESSLRYSRLFPNALIYTFEPIPSNFKLITSNINNYQNTQIKAFELCLSDKKGTADFHVSSGAPSEFSGKEVDWEFGNKSSSLLPPDKTLETYEWLQFKEKVVVPTERLDNFMVQNNIKEIDFVHMDVQGAEIMVLNGAGEKLNNLNNIWLEVESVSLYKGQPVKKDIEKFFKERGYVKLLDTVDKVAGDQFWSKKDWIIQKKDIGWLNQREKEIHTLEQSRKIPISQLIRDKIRLRTRLKSLFK
jgi:FkbM family methyltransferase